MTIEGSGHSFISKNNFKVNINSPNFPPHMRCITQAQNLQQQYLRMVTRCYTYLVLPCSPKIPFEQFRDAKDWSPQLPVKHHLPIRSRSRVSRRGDPLPLDDWNLEGRESCRLGSTTTSPINKDPQGSIYIWPTFFVFHLHQDFPGNKGSQFPSAANFWYGIFTIHLFDV